VSSDCVRAVAEVAGAAEVSKWTPPSVYTLTDYLSNSFPLTSSPPHLGQHLVFNVVGLLAVEMVPTSRHKTQLHFCKLYCKLGTWVKVMTSLYLTGTVILQRAVVSRRLSVYCCHAVHPSGLHFTDSK
jgi:hypothetical protein